MKKIELTTEDLRYLVNSTTKKLLENDNFQSFFKSGENRGRVNINTLNDGSIEIEIVGNTYAYRKSDYGAGERYKVGEQTVQTGYETLITKLRPFQNIAMKNGFNMEVSNPEMSGDETETKLRVLVRITDENGNVSQSIAKEGYEYCATVVPMEQEVKGEGFNTTTQNIPALVSVAPKFRNTDIGPALRSTTFNEKCAGCGRSVGRSQYIIYYNKNTNEIIKLGINCAVNKFGYSLAGANFMKRIQLMFSTITYGDLVAHDPDGFPIEPHLSLREMSRRSFYDKIIIPLMYHYLNEPGFRIKEYGYDTLTSEAEHFAKSWKNDNTDRATRQMKEWYVEHQDEIPDFEEYKEYWENKTPTGDWETMCKTVAMSISNEGIRIPSSQVSKFTKIIPYTIIDFVKNANKQTGAQGDDVQKHEYGVGDSIEENVPCKVVGTTFFQKYNSYLVKLVGKDGNTFSYWSSREPNFKEGGDVIIKSGYVKKIFNGDVQLSGVQIITVDKEAEIQKRNQEAEELPYPEDGTRLRDETFKVINTEMGSGYYSDNVKRATIEDKNGCKYYLFLMSDFQGRVTVKPFPYREGDTVTLTGTVHKKNGRNGTYYYIDRIILN